MFDQTIIRTAQAHAREQYPYESCGLVVDGQYISCTNTAANPLKDFRLDPGEYIRAEGMGAVRGVIHSHPDGPDHPSRADMLGQMESGLVWGIVTVIKGAALPPFFWGGDTPVPNLVGREFRHGITDCYGLVRDWYRLERHDLLPEYPRDDEWWLSGGNMLLDNFKDAGFHIVDDAPRPGDVALLQICADTVNHCGVYIGQGLMLHHLVNRCSRKDPMGRWHKHTRLMVRRDGA
ncbi:C40 family peptidase [uncultured Pseudodesulfovibrio sp.]|uniref:C40 family peptidase n=1 Tax=uncultured Pseudodesulfovibrio sp. TaxID=2035858 RepID=UPI0029C6F349|nr:C40 family peptidase [uncultured Pseudodesulfovibrio sp.]